MQNSGQIKATDPKEDKNGFLTARHNGRWWRFCKFCGKIIKDINKLDEHWRTHFDDQKDKSFLRFNEKPIQCMYSNWDAWRKSPARVNL